MEPIGATTEDEAAAAPGKEDPKMETQRTRGRRRKERKGREDEAAAEDGLVASSGVTGPGTFGGAAAGALETRRVRPSPPGTRAESWRVKWERTELEGEVVAAAEDSGAAVSGEDSGWLWYGVNFLFLNSHLPAELAALVSAAPAFAEVGAASAVISVEVPEARGEDLTEVREEDSADDREEPPGERLGAGEASATTEERAAPKLQRLHTSLPEG